MEIPRMRREEALARMDDPDTRIIDVRKEQPEAERKIKNAVLENHANVETWGRMYPEDKTLILYCAWQNEHTSAGTAQKLMEMGFKKVYALEGGWNGWVEADYPTEAIQ